MPNNLTDNEIVKALVECTKHTECEACHYMDECFDLSILHEKALDLINRQDFEIHQLEKQVSEIQNANLIDFNATVGNYKAENENLKAEIQELKTEINMFRGYDEEIKAEAYKEFAGLAVERVEKAKLKYQRLCKEQGEEMEEHMHIHFNGIIGIINNLLNELVGDKNGKDL